MRHTFTDVGSKRVHAYVIDPEEGEGSTTDSVVLVPGLGLPAYALPTAHALAARGVTVTLLDLPGFGLAEPNSTRPNIHAIGLLAAAWLMHHPVAGRTALIGHSTGAQAALTAALGVQDRHPDLRLVLAGPTFAPPQRRIRRLAWATLHAYRDDTLSQLRLREVLRGWWGVPSILFSGLADAPEKRITALRIPLTLTSGEHDAFAPAAWLHRLSTCAAASGRVRVTTEPGSHNNLFTHPEHVADVVLDSLRAVPARAAQATLA